MQSTQKPSAYCFKCKSKQEFTKESTQPAFNKRNAMVMGKCDKCGTNVSAVSKEKYAAPVEEKKQ